MNISLPPQLKRFVEKKVKDGVYPRESDVVFVALRGLRERDQLLRRMSVGDGDVDRGQAEATRAQRLHPGHNHFQIIIHVLRRLHQNDESHRFQAQMPLADPESEGGVKVISTDLFRGEIVDVSQLVAVQEDLKGKLDGMNEMSEMTSLRLQMQMDRRSKMISTLSNVLKKIRSTQDALVQNIK